MNLSDFIKDPSLLSRMAASLQQSEELFHSVFMQTDVPIAVMKMNGDYLMVNEAASRLIGYSSEEILKLNLFNLLHPSEHDMARANMEKMLSGQIVNYNLERRYIRKDGSTIWGRATTTVYRDHEGNPQGIVSVVTDLTERKEAEEELMSQNRLLNLLSDTSAYLLENRDPDQIIPWINNRVATHLGSDICLHYIPDKTNNRLHLDFSSGLSDENKKAFENQNFKQSQTGINTVSDQQIEMYDFHELFDTISMALQTLGVKAICCHPLWIANRLLGTLSFASSTRTTFSPSKLDFIHTICQYVAMALDRSRLMSEAKRLADDYEMLIQSHQDLFRSEPDLDHCMNILVQRAQTITQGDGVSVELLQDENVICKYAAGVLKHNLGCGLPLARSFSGLCIQIESPLCSEDVTLDERIDVETRRKVGKWSMIVVPLIYRCSAVGVLKIVYDRPIESVEHNMTVAQMISNVMVTAMSGAAEADIRRTLCNMENHLEMAINAANMGIWSWDIVTNRIYWSPETYEMMGIPHGTPINREILHACIHPDDRESYFKTYIHALEAHIDYEDERRIILPDGNIRWISARGRARYAIDGTPLSIEGVAMDITERKRLEQMCLDSQKMEGIGRLAGGIAHDFNNLLTVILGHAELIKAVENQEASIRQSIENIEKAAGRAASLTQQLLAFARRQMFLPCVVDINELLGNMIQMLRPLIDDHIEILPMFFDEPCRVRTDPRQLEQVILNMALNAKDAMPDGGKLTIRTRIIEVDRSGPAKNISLTPGRYVLIIVSDTGTGMSEAIKSQIFEPFFTTREVGQGTGMGLSTCYGIIKQNRGDIQVYSETGKGTIFHVYLPYVKEFDEPERKTQANMTEKPGNGTVLIVEDEEMVRLLVINTLRNAGYTVIEAKNGEEALHIAESSPQKIDILITDMVLPEMDGTELARMLHINRHEILVIFMSGYNDDTFHGRDNIPDDFQLLQKPFNTKELLMRVQKLMDSVAKTAGK